MTAHTTPIPESRPSKDASAPPTDADMSAASDGVGSLLHLFDWVALRDPTLAARLLADYLADSAAEQGGAVTAAGDRAR